MGEIDIETKKIKPKERDWELYFLNNISLYWELQWVRDSMFLKLNDLICANALAKKTGVNYREPEKKIEIIDRAQTEILNLQNAIRVEKKANVDYGAIILKQQHEIEQLKKQVSILEQEKVF